MNYKMTDRSPTLTVFHPKFWLHAILTWFATWWDEVSWKKITSIVKWTCMEKFCGVCGAHSALHHYA